MFHHIILSAQRTIMFHNIILSAQRTVKFHNIIISAQRTVMFHHIILSAQRTIMLHHMVNNMLAKCEYYILISLCNCEISNRIVILFLNIRLHHYLKNINHTLRDNNIIRKLKIHYYK